MRNYWFFLSYSRRDAIGDKFLKKFYQDLARDVAKKLGLPSDTKESEIGYFDETGNEPGDLWPDAIGRALQTSRVFICLYSRGYFNSPYCGKEFQVFLDRVGQYIDTASQKPMPPRLIIPVLWDSPDRLPKQLPKIINEIHYTHDEFGKVYVEEGLNYIMRLQQHADDYQKFLMKFSTRIVKEAEAHPLPEMKSLPSLEEVKPLFPVPVVEPRGMTETGNIGPNVIRFVFVAGTKTELQKIRKSIDSYGAQGGRDWKPYYPQGDAVEFLSLDVTRPEKLFYEQITVSDDLIDCIREAEKTNTIVVLIVDPWSIQVYQKPLLSYDEELFLNCGLLIPWNENDAETKSNSKELRDTIESTFSRNYIFNSPYIRDSVSSAGELQKKLILIINEIRRRMIQRAEVFREIASDDNSSLPIIP